MNVFRLCAVSLVGASAVLGAASAPASAEDGKDWFGRPLEACEPKCHWQWWLGRKNPQNMGPAAPAPGAPAPVAVADGATPPAPAESRALSRKTASRKPERVAAPKSWRPLEGEPFDAGGFALMGAPAREGEDAYAAADPESRVAASFGRFAALVVRRETADGSEPGALAARSEEAAALGDLAPQVRDSGLGLSNAVFEIGDGLEQVSDGAVAGLVIPRDGPGAALRLALADHPDLVALDVGVGPAEAKAKAPPSVVDLADPLPRDAAFAPPPVEAEPRTAGEPGEIATATAAPTR